MKFLALTFIAALCGSAFGSPTSSEGSALAQRDDDGPSVPGNSGFHFCKDPTHDDVKITKLSFDPASPVKGENVTILAKGNIVKAKKQLTPGAMIKFNVKWLGFSVKHLSYDLCRETDAIDCPVSGEFTISKTVKLPENMPGHDYKIEATLEDSGHQKVTCMKGKVDIQ